MDCPRCHTSNPAGGKFCVQCGSALGSPVRPAFHDRRCESIFTILSTALAPKFELLDSIGSGGMGYVFLALHRQLNSKVAIKVLHESCNSDPALVARFHREARSAAQLSHPNIIPIFDIGVAADFNYFVMMYIEGEDLGSVLEREGALPLEQSISCAAQVARALDFAHRKGIVHRDVKPANIMIERNGTAVVTDFGIARMQEAGRLTTQGAILGTPHYMSPEQARGDTVDYRADLYSLGCMMFQMVTGRLPFEAGDINALVYKHIFEAPPSPRQMRPEIPPELDAMIVRLMAKDPAERYPDAMTLIRALSRIELAQDSSPAPAVSVELLRLAQQVTTGTAMPEPDRPAAAPASWETDATCLASADQLTVFSGPPEPANAPADASGIVSLEELSSLALKDAYMHSGHHQAPRAAVPAADAAEKGEITLQELAALALHSQPGQAHPAETVLPVAPAPLRDPPDAVPFAPPPARDFDCGEQKTMLASMNSYSGAEETRLVSLEELVPQEAASDGPEVPEMDAESPAVQPDRRPAARSGMSPTVITAAVAGLAVLVLLIGFIALRRPEAPAIAGPAGTEPAAGSAPAGNPATPPPAADPVPGAAAPEAALPAATDWIARAEQAMNTRRLSSPANDNALYYYRKAAESEATRARAEQGIQRVARAYADLGRGAEAAGDKDKARSYYMKALDIDPQFPEAWSAVNRLTESRAEKAAVPAAGNDLPAAARGLVEEAPSASLSAGAGKTGEPAAPPAPRPRSGKIYESTDVDKKPEVVRQVAPGYPRGARQKGLEDIIVLRILISETGEVLETKILRGARVDPQFEKAAMEAVRQWKFTPATKSRQAVNCWLNVAVPFQLRPSSSSPKPQD